MRGITLAYLRHISLWMVLFLLVGGIPDRAHAQAIRVAVDAVPLAEALAGFSADTGIDIVFAQRLVRGKLSTCRYEGEAASEALACLLEGTGLVASPVNARQYVVTATAQAAAVAVPRQTLTGFVVDAASGEALPGAHVFLPQRRRGTTTNEAGYFALPSLPVSTYQVQVSYLGYNVADTLLHVGESRVMIPLSPITLAATGVLVEAEEVEQARSEQLPGVVAVPVQELEQLPSALGGQDLFQALGWLPGIQRAGEVTGGLIIRGSGPDQNLYLIDGAPIYHPWHAFSLISTFQTETFKDIRLYRGAFPAEHGGRLSAVLDAELRDGSRSVPRAVVALNTLNARMLIESPVTDNSSFMVSWRRSFIDKLIGERHAVEDNLGRRDTLRTGYYFYDWSAKFSVRPTPRSRLAFSYYNGRDVLDLRLPFDLSLDFSSWLRPADLFFEIDQGWGNRLYSVRYQYLYSNRFFITVTGYESSYRAQEATLVQPTSTAFVTSGYRVELRDLGLKVDADFYASLAHQVRFGLHVIDHRFNSTLDALIQHAPNVVDIQQQADRLQAVEAVAYVQDVWQPGPRWKVQPGVRLSYFSNGRYLRLSPRLGAQVTVLPEWLTLRAAATAQVQYVHRLRDRFSFLYDLVSSRWVPVGEEVQPGRGGQLTVGAESRPRPWASLSAEVFWRGARNVLLPRDEFQTKEGLDGPGIEVGTLLGQYTPGFEQSYGMELALHLRRGPWQAWLNYTGGRSRNRAPALGETTYRPARYDVPRAFQGVVQRNALRWTASLATTLRSGYPLTVPVARYALGNPLDEDPAVYLHRPDINNGRLPAYFRVDVTLGYRFAFLDARWRAQVILYNILNRRNVIDRSFDPTLPVVRSEDSRGLPLLPLVELVMEI